MTNLPFRISLGGGYPSLPISDASDAYLLDNFVSPIHDFLTLSGLCADKISFMIEPGRSMVQSHGFLVGSVLDVKWRNEKILLFLDIGTTMLPSSGQRPLRIRSLTESLAPASYRCCGPQCFESDYLGFLVAGNSTPIRGHRIIVEDVGAYDLTTAAIWSRIGPPIFGYIDGSLRQISRAGRLPQL
jgi:diaminopimelate decarboxylase